MRAATVFTAIACLSTLAWTTPARAAKSSSVSQYGITWTFTEPREVGQFASGDWWVEGPVTIQSVSPAPTANRNGSEVNPKAGRQAYDDRGGSFTAADSASYPLVLKVDESLVSSVSQAEGITVRNVGALLSQAVLTAVAAPLPATALRPSYAGTFKQHLDTSRIDWARLPNLSPPPSRPSGTELLRMAERPRVDHLSSWTIQDSCAHDNWYNGAGAHACYGREYATFVSDAALYVMLDVPEKRELATSLIQLGIDNYGVLRAGGNWAPNGGHHSARKWPIVFAARMLDDCDMLRVGLDYGAKTFGEDGQTYLGTGGTARFGWDCAGGQGTYLQDGCTGGGAKDCRDPAGAIDGCADYRDCCTSAYWVGEMLSTLMLRSQPIWGYDPFFAYVDRWMKGDVSTPANTSSAFVTEMWKLYRDGLPPGTPASTTCGEGGDGGAPASDGGSAAPLDGGGPGAPGAGGDDPLAGGADASDGGCACHVSNTRAGSILWLLSLCPLLAWRIRRALRARRR